MKVINVLILSVSFILGMHTCYSQKKATQTYQEAVTINKMGFMLSGTLSLPQKKGKFPAVILIAGSGPHTRQSMISGTAMFDQVASFFLQQNIAVLQVDKRGVGKSTGNYDSTNTGQFAEDVKSWYNFLTKRIDIKTDNIGLFGHSEGAIIAPMVASSEPGIKWIILAAPTGVSGDEIDYAQRFFNALKAGRLKGDTLNAVMKQFKRMGQFAKSNEYSDTSQFYSIGHDFIAAHGMAEDRITHKLINQVLGSYRTKETNYFFNLDPTVYLKQLTIPVLAMFSPVDEQVFLDQNLFPFTKAIGESKSTDITISILPEQDHFFLTYDGSRVDKHVFGKMNVSKLLLDSVEKWLVGRVKKNN